MPDCAAAWMQDRRIACQVHAQLQNIETGRSAGLFDLDYGRSETVSNSILWVIWPPLQGLMFAILMLRYLMSRSRRSYSLDAWHMIICLLVVAKLAPRNWATLLHGSNHYPAAVRPPH